MKTKIENVASHFTKDNLVQINQLPWEISSDKTLDIIGEIYEEYLQSDDSKNKLMPKEQLTFTDLDLTTSLRCFYFDENDQLYNVWYSFSFPDPEQAKQKMDEVVEYFKNTLPTITVEPDGSNFNLHIKLASNKNGHSLF
jgi:LPS O-antigen subunit length determinant protein (WzzB/FepE family)